MERKREEESRGIVISHNEPSSDLRSLNQNFKYLEIFQPQSKRELFLLAGGCCVVQSLSAAKQAWAQETREHGKTDTVKTEGTNKISWRLPPRNLA